MFAKPGFAAHQPAVGLAVEPGSVAACVRIAPGAEPLAPEGKALAIGAAARPVAVQQRLAHQTRVGDGRSDRRTEEHTSELQSLMRILYADFCLKHNSRVINSTSTLPRIKHRKCHSTIITSTISFSNAN